MRVDHIIVSGAVGVVDKSAVPWPDFVNPNRGVDHHPTVLQVSPPVQSRARISAVDEFSTIERRRWNLNVCNGFKS